MTLEQLQEWVALGARLQKANPEKFAEIVEALEETVGANEVIASFDWQLFLRPRRPKKRYEA